MNSPSKPLIIANISGFYGDRLSGAQEMLDGGPVHYLTGDYLAELTMAILYKAKMKRSDLGYAKSFLKQMEGIMGPCIDKGVKVVVNAGGLNPKGLARALRDVANELKVNTKIAFINLKESKLMPVSANAYMGCWGIVEALNRGADIVVTGRVADTSVVMGPAAHHFAWAKDNWDALAGAATAGHIIECSGQATGGNYSYFDEVPSFKNIGFPIAQIKEDGSSIITKHEATGGIVNVGTVTSQLMYEINAPEYITPDVVAHFDTIKIQQDGQNRVSISDVKGTPATDTSKVTVNCMDGFQNSMTFQIVGIDTEKKVEVLKKTILSQLDDGKLFDELKFQYIPNPIENPESNEQSISTLSVFVKDNDPHKAGKLFTSKLIEMALCMVPGICWANAPGPAKPRIMHFPALIGKEHIQQEIHIEEDMIKLDEKWYEGDSLSIQKPPFTSNKRFDGDKRTEYLGRIAAARSGDKGGNANLGIWGKTEESFAFLHSFLTVDKVKELLPDLAEFEIRRYEFPNLLGLNFYVIGLLQDGVAASTRIDPQAKTLGEYLRSKKVEIPISLLSEL